MRKDKNQRRFYNYVCQTGPSYIRKDTIGYDSCAVYPIRTGYYWDSHMQTRQSWEEGMANLDNSALFRPDPFGINDYAVNFSLNKKKRWEINEEIAERIEEVQDPRKNLRVSASVHTQDVSQCGYFFSGTPRDLECTEYHSVSRDGTTIAHRISAKGRTRLGDFTHPDPRPPRTHNGRRSRAKGSCNEDSDLPVDENSKYQKAHVHYTTTQLTARPSLHNKASHRSRKCSMVMHGKDFKYTANPVIREDREKSCATEEEEVNDEEEIVKNEVDEDLAEFVVIVEENTDDDFIVADRSSAPTVVDDLSMLVVGNRKLRKCK